MRRLVPLSLLALACSACPEKTESAPDAGLNLASRCQSGSEWTSEQAAFTNESEKWGFNAMVVKGVRFNVLDYDDDGFPDLLVRKADGPEDFAAEGVRKRWLLHNTGNGKFEDATESSGIFTDREGNPGALIGDVVVAGDFNNDGHSDIFIAASSDDGSRASELKLGRGDGTFSFATDSSDARLSGRASLPSGLSLTDFDRDGRIDLWMTQNKTGNQSSPMADRFFYGDGSGGFLDASSDVGINTLAWNAASAAQLNNAEGNSYSWGSNACDLNNDGIAELLSPAYGRSPNHLWLGSNDSYSNHSVASGYAYDDNQDWSDNESARCWCKLNPGDAECSGMLQPRIRCNQNADAFRWRHANDRQAFRLGGNSGGTLCGDIDNDGWMDLITSEIKHWDVGANSDESEILFNSGETPLRFDRPGNPVTGIERRKPQGSWDEGIITNNLIDFDNDGWLDLYFGGTDYPTNRSLLYHQLRPRQFEKVSPNKGIDMRRAHGSAVADFDRDGDLDMVVGHSRSRCGDSGECLSPAVIGFYENTGISGNNWLQIKLVGGAGTNRWAIGAQVKAKADGFSQMQELSAGQGHYGNQNDRLLHFGLGSACTAEIEIRWPDLNLSKQTLTLQAGYRYEIVQGEAPQVLNP
jgi:hypothetical protein